MKRRTYLLIMLLYCFVLNAQYSYEAAVQPARLFNITYDLEDEDVLYAVSDINHIVVSYDNGTSWDDLYTHPDGGAFITNLRILPGSENLCFSILYSPDEKGLYILNIESATIVKYLELPQLELNPSISDFDIYDEEAGTVIVNVSNDLGYHVYYTSTGGEYWNLVYDSDDYGGFAPQRVAISPDNPSKLFIARGGSYASDLGGGILISEDAGESWTQKLPEFFLSALAIDPTDHDDMIAATYTIDDEGYNKYLYRSTDGGSTWNEIVTEWTDGYSDKVAGIAFHPEINGIIYILDVNEIAFSENDGETWSHAAYEEQEYYDGRYISVNPFYQKEAIISSNYFSLRTVNGGQTISTIDAPYYYTNNVQVKQINGVDQLYYSGQRGNMHKNYTTGSTGVYNTFVSSQILRNQVMVDPYVEGRLFLHDHDDWHPDQKTDLYISFDHGATRTLLLTFLYSENNYLPLILACASDPNMPNYIYAIITDYGACRLYKFDVSDPSNITHEILPLPLTNPEGQNLNTVLHIIDVNGASVMFTNKNNKVYSSADGGNTWAELATISEAAMIWDMDINPWEENGMAVATDSGIFTSGDGGITWEQHLPGIQFKNVKYSPVEENIIAAGIHPSEADNAASLVYFNGTDWVPVDNQELNYISPNSYDFSFGQGLINAYIATHDMGIVKYTFEIGELGTSTPGKDVAQYLFYPNPAVSIIKINTVDFTPQKVVIYNLKGQLVHSGTSDTIDISGFAQGVYVVGVYTDEDLYLTGRLIKE